MQTTIKEQLQNTYPPILSLENIRVILRISKRKAAWMLHNGYIKCTINEKKTRNYQIKIEDLFEYIDKAESLDPSIQFPSGLFSSRKTKTHREESSVIAPCIIHQKPSDDFRDWIQEIISMLSNWKTASLISSSTRNAEPVFSSAGTKDISCR